MNTVKIGCKELHGVSKDLYMQFMEPLGKTDGSVEAAWNWDKDDWREDVIDVTSKLAPSIIRYGGVFSAYYKWKEGVGNVTKRKPMYNIEWGGLESNRIGTHEYVDFCRRVGAQPFININFESDGQERWAHPSYTDARIGYADEAAEWVDYCNNPDNTLRKSHGHAAYNVKLWQIGNETSHIKGGFDGITTAKKTAVFAKKMKAADKSIRLMGWGDHGYIDPVMQEAGEYLDYIDYHNLFGRRLTRANSPLLDKDYQVDPEKTWCALMSAYQYNQEKLAHMREDYNKYKIPLALCESHFAIQSRNRGEVLSTWAAGAAYARIMNLYERNGDMLKIANISDFCGNIWLVNSVMIPMPAYWKRTAYLMPVALCSMLFSNNMGENALTVNSPDGLDITASESNGKIFLHVVNTNFSKSVRVNFEQNGNAFLEGRIKELNADPMFEVNEFTSSELTVQEKTFDSGEWCFPPASVSVVELKKGQCPV